MRDLVSKSKLEIHWGKHPVLTSLAFKCTCAHVEKCLKVMPHVSWLTPCLCGFARFLGEQLPFSPPFDTLFLWPLYFPDKKSIRSIILLQAIFLKHCVWFLRVLVVCASPGSLFSPGYEPLFLCWKHPGFYNQNSQPCFSWLLFWFYLLYFSLFLKVPFQCV